MSGIDFDRQQFVAPSDHRRRNSPANRRPGDFADRARGNRIRQLQASVRYQPESGASTESDNLQQIQQQLADIKQRIDELEKRVKSGEPRNLRSPCLRQARGRLDGRVALNPLTRFPPPVLWIRSGIPAMSFSPRPLAPLPLVASSETTLTQPRGMASHNESFGRCSRGGRISARGNRPDSRRTKSIARADSDALLAIRTDSWHRASVRGAPGIAVEERRSQAQRYSLCVYVRTNALS